MISIDRVGRAQCAAHHGTRGARACTPGRPRDSKNFSDEKSKVSLMRMTKRWGSARATPPGYQRPAHESLPKRVAASLHAHARRACDHHPITSKHDVARTKLVTVNDDPVIYVHRVQLIMPLPSAQFAARAELPERVAARKVARDAV